LRSETQTVETQTGVAFGTNTLGGNTDNLSMKPRMIVAGTTYMVTRRTSQRQFLLRPSKETNQIFRYCLAWASERYKVDVHAVCVLSNHYHLVCTDPAGQLPSFVAELHKLVAKCVNANLGRWENLWAGGAQPSYVRLEGDRSQLEKAAYVLANPVEAGLVGHGKDWPGERLWQPGEYQARRPRVFFSDAGRMPKKLKLRVVALPTQTPSPTERLRRLFQQREASVRDSFHAAGRSFLGATAVKAQSITGRPCTKEPRRRLSPRIACRDKWRRIEALQQLESFVSAYRLALKSWRSGLRRVVFPAGTFRMAQLHAVVLPGGT